MAPAKEKEMKEWFPLIVATHRESAKMAPTKGGKKSRVKENKRTHGL